MSSTPPKRRLAAAAPGRQRQKPKAPTKKPLSIWTQGLLLLLFVALFLGAAVTASFFAPRHVHRQSIVAAAPEEQQEPGLANPQAAITISKVRLDRVPMILATGGIVGTRRDLHRRGIGDFVREYGAAVGLNGTFFANASLNGNDNLLIGPSLCGNEPAIVRGPYDDRPPLLGRPLVLMSPTRTRILAYNPKIMDEDADIRALLPGVTDVFLGGVWLVHRGVAATPERLARFAVTDAEDPRRRAFFGLMPDGRPVLGATTDSVGSLQLARALQDAGLQEAVLLDSGFSTSLVWHNHVLVSGHSSPGIPSRPVPHAILLFGQPDVASRNIRNMLQGT